MAWLGAGVPILLFCALASGFAGAVLGGYISFSRGLPDIPDLRRYRPKTVSTFYAEDGTVIGIFYREKRFPIGLDTMPTHVVNAFLAAEDARFFSHPGVDLIGVGRAVVKNIKAGSFSHGGSTITQQVTRSFLLSREKKISRKIREALLAFRLEKTLSKHEILQIYLNEIYLGKGAYGVEAAAKNYFGKSTKDLTIAEAALLAGIIPNPNQYSPHRNLKACLTRRAFVLDHMLKNRFITQEQYSLAMANHPEFRENLPNTYQEEAPYFAEAVRQYIVEKYGEDRLYNEGLKVWTTCDLSLQKTGSRALLHGVQSWEKRRRRPVGLIERLKSSQARLFLAKKAPATWAVGDVVEALVLKNNTAKKPKKKRKRKKGAPLLQECSMALPGGARFTIDLTSTYRYRKNDVLRFRIAQVQGTRLSLEPMTLPPVQGAVVCIENNTGYVRALVGGLDFQRSRFNRAIQAKRQPGSAFKPFVYTAAVEWGRYGPQTLVVDEPIVVEVDPKEPEWIPANSDGNYFGPINVRQALALSRNIPAVKLIMDVGIDNTIRMARNMGIESTLGRNISLCLGASEVTPLELTSAYSVLPNMGMRIHPVLVRKVVDRFGNVLEDNTMEPLRIEATFPQGIAPGPPQSINPVPPVQAQWQSTPTQVPLPTYTTQQTYGQRAVQRATGSVESVLSDSFPSGLPTTRPSAHRVLSAQSAYLMASMLSEVCRSGTGAAVAKLGRKDLAGKTGTTDDCTDAWFVGFNPQYTTGVWIGYDTKTSLGKKEYGNRAALPVWMDFMKEALRDSPSQGYPVPPGIVFWDLRQPIETARREDLIHAAPDVPLNSDAKPMCPVDSGMVPVSYQADPYADQPIPLAAQAHPMPGQNMPGQSFAGAPFGSQPVNTGFDTGSYPGTIRVLSPQGETLGHAYYSMDEKGEMVLFREDSQPYDPYLQQPVPQGPPGQHYPGWGPPTDQPQPSWSAPGHSPPPHEPGTGRSEVDGNRRTYDPYWNDNGWH
jgi:penicillin-binding protein 1A